MKDKEETKNEQPQQQQPVDYDKQWNVSGYYLDDEGFDIRDRD